MINKNNDDLIIEKLTILYALNNIANDVTDAQLTQIILSTEVLDYFTLMALLPKMLETKVITTYNKNNNTLYSITQNGLEALNSFNDRIPDYFKKKIDKYIRENTDDLFSVKMNFKSNYIKKDDSCYNITLVAIKGLNEVLNVNISVETENDALLITKNWNESNVHKYSQIVDILLNK